MGAAFETADVPKDQKIESWYDAAVDDARFWHGHAPYSGTISETSGVRDCTDLHFATRAEAEEWLMQNARKWEDALVVTHGEQRERLCGFWAAT